MNFPKLELQATWGNENVALFALEDGTGAGPAVWCHGVVPDQHAFRSSNGGWVIPWRNHAAEADRSLLAPTICARSVGLTDSRIGPATGVLTLPLHTAGYVLRTLRTTGRLSHIPFPADPEAFRDAARIGARLRALQTFAEAPAEAFRHARLVGQASGPTLDVPTPQRAFAGDGEAGYVALLSDQSLAASANVSERTWPEVSISRYKSSINGFRAGHSVKLPRFTAKHSRLLVDR